MKVILTADVAKIGRRHEVKEVSDGYARNFLIGKGLAVPATGEHLAKLQADRKNAEAKKNAEVASIKGELEKLAGLKLLVKRDANEEGVLFAALKPQEIVRELAAKGVSLPVEYLKIPKSLKELGDFEIPIEAKEAGKGTLYLSVVK